MAHIRRSVELLLPDADLIVPSYPAGTFANTDPSEIAESLEYVVNDTVRDRSERPDKLEYEKIFLIGFSIGALILRATYLHGRGLIKSFHRSDLLKGPPVPSGWTRIPIRIILLAGMNRGWKTSPKPPKMKMRTWVQYKFGAGLARLTRSGRLVRSAQNGAPFVADLRVRWKLLQLVEGDSAPQPEIYQLLGTTDDLVSEEDQTDLFLTKDFVFIPVVETGHREILELDDSEFGKRRKEIVGDVISKEKDELKEIYQREHERVLAKQDTKPESHVVFLMHGIRDFGRWTQLLANTFHRKYPEIAVRAAKYRYFPMGAFLLLNARQKYVRWFMDLYTEEVAKNPKVDISFVGHSNGTYILASAMELYSSIEMHNVVFAGSVVPREYPWTRWQYEGRINAVQNYIASKDWVVAIFPRLFELIAEITPFNVGDIGSAGFNGFQDPVGNQFEHIVRGGHSGALDVRNHDRIALFIDKSKDSLPHPDLRACDVDKYISTASRLCWLVWSILVWAVIELGFFFTGNLNGVTQLSTGILAVVYAFLIWLLLQTI